jgi:hypothetical protein
MVFLEMALSNVAKKQKLLVEMQQTAVTDLLDLSPEPALEQALRSILLLLEFPSAKVISWVEIRLTLSRMGFMGLQRRIKSFNEANLAQSPQIVALCLESMSELCPNMQLDNVLTSLNGRPRPALEIPLVEKLFDWASHCIQEARARMSLVAIRTRRSDTRN